jgi:hypothetical protein
MRSKIVLIFTGSNTDSNFEYIGSIPDFSFLGMMALVISGK